MADLPTDLHATGTLGGDDGSAWFESAYVEPDLVLADIICAAHPEIPSSENCYDNLHYLRHVATRTPVKVTPHQLSAAAAATNATTTTTTATTTTTTISGTTTSLAHASQITADMCTTWPFNYHLININI